MTAEGSYLLPMHSTVARDRRTSLPIVASRFTVRPSGLLVPEEHGREAAPIDQIKTYLTATEVFGGLLDPNLLIRTVEGTSFEVVLVYVADLLCRLDRPGCSSEEVDNYFLQSYVPEPLRTRLRNHLHEPGRALVTPQTLFMLLKLSAAKSPRNEEELISVGSLALSLLILADQAGSTNPDEVDESVTKSEIMRLVVAAGHFYGSVHVVHSVGRFVSQWLKPPERVKNNPKFADLAGHFFAQVGVEIEDLVTLALTFHSRSIVGAPFVNYSYLEGLGWDSSRLDKALELISVDRGELQEHVANLPETSLEWDISIFERFPIVRLDHNRFVVVRPDLLLKRVFGFLPVWDLRSSLSPEQKDLRKAIDASVALVGEDHALDSLDHIAQARSARLFGADEIKKRLGGQGRKTCDAAIREGKAWTLFEITSTQLRRETVAGLGVEHLEDDLKKLLPKCRQLDHTLSALRLSATTLSGETEPEGRRFFPVLLMTEGFPVNPMTVDALRDRLRREGVCQGDDVAPIEIMDSVDLDMIEGLREFPTPAVHRLIADKQAGAMLYAGMRDYLLLARREVISSPDRIVALWKEAMVVAVSRMPETPDTEDYISKLRDETS